MTTAALFLFGGLLGACSTSEPPAPAPGAVAGVTADKIIENPNAYVGKTVTVSGDVEGIFGPRAFEIDDGLNVGTLLVLGREPFPQVPDAGNRAYVIDDTATVTGVVRMMVVADIEREIGWDLESHIEAEYTAKPVLLAQQVGFRPGTNRRAATTGTPMANTSDNMGNANAGNMNAGNRNAGTSDQPLTSLSNIISAPNKESLVGRRVQLDDVQVQKVVSDRGFWLGEADNRMFARLDQRLNQGSAEWDVSIREGQTRALWGEIRALPGMDEISEWRLMSAADAKTLQDRGYYIHVERLQETRRPVGR